MNRYELFAAMIERKLINLKGVTGFITSIELEDGSGHCFNVKLVTPFFSYITVFVRG